MSKENKSSSNAFSHGAEWARADFHLHTHADDKFRYDGDSEYYNSTFVDALEKANVKLGVIANHNKFDLKEFKELRSTAQKKGVGLLPGVELSVTDGKAGVHVLIVFSDAWIEGGDDQINPFIAGMFPGKTKQEYEHENGCSEKTLLQMVEVLDGLHRDYFLVFAHVEGSKGLWHEVGCGKLNAWQEKRYNSVRCHTLGFQKVRSYNKLEEKGTPCRKKAQEALGEWYPAEVEGSDPENMEEIGKGKACYVKLGELSFEAVKFALFDYERRCRTELPEPRTAVQLRSIRFEGAKLDGIEIPFSASLNCLIGPRGNGKSAIIECCRHALDFPLEGCADDQYKTGLVQSILTPGGKVVLNAVDEFDREVRIERERSGPASVFVDGQYREINPSSVLKDILYFGQKDLSVRSESFDEHFLERLLADRLPSRFQEEQRLVEEVNQAAKQLQGALDVTEKLESYRKEMNELNVQLQVYADKGVDKKLQRMTLFDADRQAVVSWQLRLKNLLGSIRVFEGDWFDLEADVPVFRSELIKPAIPDFEKIKEQVNAASNDAKSSVAKLLAAVEAISAALVQLDPIQKKLKSDLGELQQSLEEPNLDLELFRRKKSRLEQLKKFLATGAQRGKTEQVAREALGAAVQSLHEFRRRCFQEREKEIRLLEKELPEDICIRTEFKAKKSSFDEFLRVIMRGSGLQSTVYETLSKAFSDGWDLYAQRSELEKKVTETAAVKIRSALADNLSAFVTFRVPDCTEIVFKGIPLNDYSLGQRATVILHFLMHMHRHPVIIIDQPEDDLDNETLYSHFIQQLLDRKEDTQFVFATHNPNIPVLGDAEQAVVCRHSGEEFSFEHGGIDAKKIQKRIITVMEGGEAAFKRRKEIYQLWKNSN